jgi:hypothetical protein
MSKREWDYHKLDSKFFRTSTQVYTKNKRTIWMFEGIAQQIPIIIE